MTKRAQVKKVANGYIVTTSEFVDATLVFPTFNEAVDHMRYHFVEFDLPTPSADGSGE